MATNNPSFIWREKGSPCTLLCGFPPFPRQKSPGFAGGITLDGHLLHDQAFAVGSAAESNERLLIVSNSIVFSDGLLAQKDIDNCQFCVNAMHWLVEDPGDPNIKRKYALFIDKNTVIDDFDVPIGEPPQTTTRMINNLLRKLEEENFFNLVALELAGRGNQEAGKLRILRVFAVALILCLIVYSVRRYFRARHHSDVAVPLIEAKLAQTVVEFVPALIKRDKLALRGNDFREAARTLARLCFEQTPGHHHAKEPPRVAEHVRRRRGLEAAVDRLWNLAYGAWTEPVSADEFAELAADVWQVQTALERGTLQWVRNT
jgi:hypothetical protein